MRKIITFLKNHLRKYFVSGQFKKEKKPKPILSYSDALFLDRLRNGVQFDNIDFFRAFWQGGIVLIIGLALLWSLVFFTTGRNMYRPKKLDSQDCNCHQTNNNGDE